MSSRNLVYFKGALNLAYILVLLECGGLLDHPLCFLIFFQATGLSLDLFELDEDSSDEVRNLPLRRLISFMLLVCFNSKM